MRGSTRAVVAVIAGLSLIAAGCTDDDDEGGPGSDAARPTVVATTNILGDVVADLVGDELDVVTIMPVGADPHDFQPSARQVAQLGDADVLIVNGADFEESLLDVIAASDGDVSVFEAISAVETLEFGEEAADHGDEGEHGHEGVDPHFFTDPARMALVAEAIAEFLVATVEGVDAAGLTANAQAYIDELEALDAEVARILSVIPEDGRVLVTNHEVFAYFADRYGFEVVGAVIPGGTTDGASARELVELAEVIEREGVSAIFADTSSSDELAQTLAAEVGDIAVVELFSESLGPDESEGATYPDMVRANARRIADALAG